MKRSRHQQQENAERDLQFAARQPVRQPHAIAGMKLDTGAISAKPISDTKPSESGGNCCDMRPAGDACSRWCRQW